MFGQAVANQNQYLKVGKDPKDEIKWPEIEGRRQKQMPIRCKHLNSFLLESDMKLFNVKPVSKRNKRKTVMGKHAPPSHSSQGLDLQ